MSQLLLLPGPNEWKLLEKCYAHLNLQMSVTVQDVLSHKKVFGFFAPFAEFKNDPNLYVPNLTDEYAKLSRLMLYLARLYWDKCPLPILNIVRDIEIHRDDFLGDYEDISHVFDGDGFSDFNRTSFTRFLSQLKDEGLIKVRTYKDWIAQYGEEGTIEEDNSKLIKRSSSQIFPLTAMGTIMYEYIINTPSMFMSYLSAYFEPDFTKQINANNLSRSQNRYNTSTSPLITLSVAARVERLSLFVDSPFHYKLSNQHAYNDYHEKIDHEQSEILGNDRSFFIEIHNPATKILREVKALIDLENFYDLKKTSRLKNKNYTSEELVEKLFKMKIQNDIKLLEDIWVNLLGLDQKLLYKHIPSFSI